MLSHKNEFSRFAKNYVLSNDLQKKIAKHLLSLCPDNPKHILDLGCGGGEVYKNISWYINKLIAIDNSYNMCNLHPKNPKIDIIQADFDDDKTFDLIKQHFDIIISSSALHWSYNIDKLMHNISKLSNQILISTFTSNSLSNLHNYLNIKSPICSKSKILTSIESRFHINTLETKNYKINFSSSKELLLFIKHTGISGGKQIANISDIFQLIRNDKIKTLDFEVVYVYGFLK